jgi:hypothetical protein
MEIPGAEKADLAPAPLLNRRRVAERRRAPRHTSEDANKACDVGDEARGYYLGLARDREAFRQPGVAQRREEAVG